MACPVEHFNKPSLARVAERCFKSSVKFNPTNLEGSGILRYQTNSMSFYQKLNIRQNTIEGNLLKRDKIDIERERIQNLRSIKRTSIELRHDMRGYNEYYRTKIKRRKDAKLRRKEEKERRERGDTELGYRPASTQSLPVTKSKYYCTNYPSVSSTGLQIEPAMMEKLGLQGIDIPNVPVSWGKVSRTVLNLHKNWAKEKNLNRFKRGNSAKSDPGIRHVQTPEIEPHLSSPEKNRRATKSHQSYFQSCLARPFSYEDFSDRRITCKENEAIWVKTLREANPPLYKRFTCSGEEKSLMKRQFSERNIKEAQKAKISMRELEETIRSSLAGTDVNDRITRMKFTSTRMLEERAELDRRAEEGRVQTDRCIRRHKYMDKSVSVEDIINQRPSYLRYRRPLDGNMDTAYV